MEDELAASDTLSPALQVGRFRGKTVPRWKITGSGFGLIDVDGGTVRAQNIFPAEAAHVVRHDPARVLREVGAKRDIVKFHPITRDVIAVKPDGLHGFGCATCHQDEGLTMGYGWCATLLALAAVYADHPDYRAEWRTGEDPS
jgi:hypothetical protein